MDFAYNGSQFLSRYTLIDRFIVVRLQIAKIRKRIVSFQHHISKPNAINGVEREIIVDNPAKELAEE